jgi:hypothetical protein
MRASCSRSLLPLQFAKGRARLLSPLQGAWRQHRPHSLPRQRDRRLRAGPEGKRFEVYWNTGFRTKQPYGHMFNNLLLAFARDSIPMQSRYNGSGPNHRTDALRIGADRARVPETGLRTHPGVADHGPLVARAQPRPGRDRTRASSARDRRFHPR